jgi:hypothetical protein
MCDVSVRHCVCGIAFSTDGSLICASQRHFHYNVCAIEESSTGLVRFQACEMNIREDRMHVCVKWGSGSDFSSEVGDDSTRSHHGPVFCYIP